MKSYLRPIKNAFLFLTGSWGKHLLFLQKLRKRTKSLQRKFTDTPCKRTNVFYFIMDERLKQPGLADRLKAIVSCYYIARENNYDFQIVADAPFDMTPYLESNQMGGVNLDELEYSKQDTLTYDYVPWRGFPHFPKGKQIHCFNYMGHSIFSQVHHKYPKWGTLFKELFKPTALLEENINECHLPKTGYVAVHLRFVNSLEDFEVYHQRRLTGKQKISLIDRCKNALKSICTSDEKPVYVFSDSKIF